MPLRFGRLGWIACWAVIGARSAPEPAPAMVPVVSVRDFFRPLLFRSPQFNASGTRLAALVALEDDHTAAFLLDLKTRTGVTITAPGDRDIYALDWLDDRQILLSGSTEKLWADGLFVLDTEHPDRVHAIERHSAVTIIGIPRCTPLRPIIWIHNDAYGEGVDGGVVQIDANASVDEAEEMGQTARLLTGARTAVETQGTAASVVHRYPKLPAGRAEGYLPDRNGELAFAVALDHGTERLFLLRDSQWVRSPLDLDRYDIVAAGDGAEEVLALGPRQTGMPRALLRIDAATGRPTAVVDQGDRFDPDVRLLFRHPATRALIGVGLHRNRLETVWSDPDFAKIQRQLEGSLPGMVVTIIDSDPAAKRIIIGATSDRAPPSCLLLDRTTSELRPIKNSAPWIPVERMRPTQSMSFKARDGCAVDCYLTLPEGAAKKKPLPLVVLLHGGPWARDDWDWNPEVQFLASRGYAVFQPNYRGSAGSDWKFPEGDEWDFRKMHQDVTDGVRQLLESDWFDARRVAIMGASFGGYLAMCGAADEPGLYRCAITAAGVFDWSQMMKEARRNRDESLRYEFMLHHLGDPRKSEARFAEISPMKRIDQVRIPILVAHGKDDPVVSVEQSKRLIAELKRRNVPCEVLIKRGEGHGMSRLDDRVEFYTMVEAFLARHLRAP